MEQILVDMLTDGKEISFMLLFVGLLFYNMRENEKREAGYRDEIKGGAEREKAYQETIKALVERDEDIQEIKALVIDLQKQK